MSDTPQKTNPHNIVATVEETQKMTLNTSKTKHFANTICVLVTGIVLKFLKVSLSLSIKNKSAAIIPNIHGSSNSIPKPITDCQRASNASVFVAYLSCATFK